MTLLGIDIGGTGIKGAPVDVETGQLVGERFRIETPQPSVPNAVADVVEQIAAHFSPGARPELPFPLSSSMASPIRPPTSTVHGSARMRVSSFPNMSEAL